MNFLHFLMGGSKLWLYYSIIFNPNPRSTSIAYYVPYYDGAQKSRSLPGCGLRLTFGGAHQEAAHRRHQHSDRSAHEGSHGPHSPVAEDGRRRRGRCRRYCLRIPFGYSQDASTIGTQHRRRRKPGHYNRRDGCVFSLRSRRFVPGHASDGVGDAAGEGHQIGGQ